MINEAIEDFYENYTFPWCGGRLSPNGWNENGILFLATFQCLKLAVTGGLDERDKEFAKKAIQATTLSSGATVRSPTDSKLDSHDNHNGRAMLCMLHSLREQSEAWLSFGQSRFYVFDNTEPDIPFWKWVLKAYKAKDFEAIQQPSTVFLFDYAANGNRANWFRSIYFAAALAITSWHFMTWAMILAIHKTNKLRGWRRFLIYLGAELFLRKIRNKHTLRQLFDGYFQHPDNPYAKLASEVTI